jgi:hypothetical protein
MAVDKLPWIWTMNILDLLSPCAGILHYFLPLGLRARFSVRRSCHVESGRFGGDGS